MLYLSYIITLFPLCFGKSEICSLVCSLLLFLKLCRYIYIYIYIYILHFLLGNYRSLGNRRFFWSSMMVSIWDFSYWHSFAVFYYLMNIFHETMTYFYKNTIKDFVQFNCVLKNICLLNGKRSLLHLFCYLCSNGD